MVFDVDGSLYAMLGPLQEQREDLRRQPTKWIIGVLTRFHFSELPCECRDLLLNREDSLAQLM
jgi:hypothetical protein